MTSIKIEENVPLPVRHQIGVTATLAKMKIGDSILVPLAARNGISGLAMRVQIKVTTRKEGSGHVRVWRTA